MCQSRQIKIIEKSAHGWRPFKLRSRLKCFSTYKRKTAAAVTNNYLLAAAIDGHYSLLRVFGGGRKKRSKLEVATCHRICAGTAGSLLFFRRAVLKQRRRDTRRACDRVLERVK